MAEKTNVPEIRFAGFTDPWEQRKLGELMDVASVRRVHQEDWTDEGVRFLRARDLVSFAKNESIEDPLFISSEMYKEYSAQSGKVSVGDLLVTGVGTIGVPWLVTSDNPVYFKDGNIIWFKNRYSIDGGFFYHSFTASAIQNYINEAAGIGTVGTYTIETGKKTPIWLPSRQEQREIAAMMTHLDTLITLHQRKYDKLAQLKKSMLDKMFPKPGERFPEIRFAGFTDPWEQRKLGDCFEFLKNDTLSRAGLNGENGTARNVHYGDILIKFGDCLDGERSDLPFITDDTVLPKFAGSILREGDVIFADTAEDEAAGKCVELRKLPKEPTISGLHTIPARPRFPFGTGYLGHYLNSDAYHRQLLPLMQGIKVISVSKAALQDTQVRFPGLSEQTAIGAALSEIDTLITLHQ